MRILFLCDYYRPDGGPATPLFTMLSEELAKRGHSVAELTAAPHYPSGKVPVKYKGWVIKETIVNNVKVIRVSLPSISK